MEDYLYGLLSQFSNNSKSCKTHLEKKYSPDLLNFAIEKGYIVEIYKNKYGEPVYSITTKGKNYRDK